MLPSWPLRCIEAGFSVDVGLHVDDSGDVDERLFRLALLAY